MERQPELVIVAGDVNSTLACALAAVKLGIPVAHLEAGLRFDWTMPEEINRVLTDRVSDVLFTHSPEAHDNLRREGIEHDRILFVGNTMIDIAADASSSGTRATIVGDLAGSSNGGYVLVTLHRPSNVDDPVRLTAIVDASSRSASVPWSSRSIRAPARDWTRRAGLARLSAATCAASSRPDTSTSSRSRAPPARSSPTPAACRRRRRPCESRASRSAPTPSAP